MNFSLLAGRPALMAIWIQNLYRMLPSSTAVVPWGVARKRRPFTFRRPWAALELVKKRMSEMPMMTVARPKTTWPMPMTAE